MENLHCENARKVKDKLIDEVGANNLSQFFKALGDPTRLKVLFCMREGEICVHDISILLNISQPRVSNQLRYLRQEKLVKTRKTGNQVFYSLDDEHIEEIISVGCDHVNHTLV